MEAGCCGNHNFAFKFELKFGFCEVIEFGCAHMIAKFQPQQSELEEVVKFETLKLGCGR